MSTERHYGWMWVQACEVLDHAERLQRQFLRYTGPGVDAAVWEPPVDIHETSDGLSLLFALPGVAPEAIEITLEPNALTVSATRPLTLAHRESVIRRLEIPHGRFVRRIALKGARMQVAETRYVNGCLEVRLTWAAVQRARE
jgi:HSP20 family molecular chaperone IbpA